MEETRHFGTSSGMHWANDEVNEDVSLLNASEDYLKTKYCAV